MVCVVFGRCNWSFLAHFSIVFESSYRCLDAISMLPLPSFLDTYSLSIPSREWKTLCIVMCLLVHWSIPWSSYLVHFKNNPEYRKRGQPKWLSLWGDFCYVLLLRVVIPLSRDTLFKSFFSSSLVCRCPLPVFPSICKLRFLRVFCFLFFFSFLFFIGYFRSFPYLSFFTSHS